MDKGLFGAPSFTTPDGELFWGFDRMEEALEWAASHACATSDASTTRPASFETPFQGSSG